jgi:hypothetical protein
LESCWFWSLGLIFRSCWQSELELAEQQKNSLSRAGAHWAYASTNGKAEARNSKSATLMESNKFYSPTNYLTNKLKYRPASCTLVQQFFQNGFFFIFSQKEKGKRKNSDLSSGSTRRHIVNKRWQSVLFHGKHVPRYCETWQLKLYVVVHSR